MSWKEREDECLINQINNKIDKYKLIHIFYHFSIRRNVKKRNVDKIIYLKYLNKRFVQNL